MGFLERMKNSYLCRADSSGGAQHSAGPPCLEPLTKKSCLAPRSIRRWRAWQAQGRHCLCPGLSLAIVLSNLPKPSGMGSCPCNLTQRARQGGLQSHRRWATGRRAQA